MRKRSIFFIESLLLSSKWLTVPLYFLLVALIIPSSFRAFSEVIEIFKHIGVSKDTELLIGVLSLIDNIMVINLLGLIAIGSYQIFVRKFSFRDEKDKPHWLNHVNASTLKIKLNVSIIGVSSIHLLKDFINSENTSWTVVLKHSVIHGLFIISTLALAYTDKILHPKTEEKQMENEKH